MWMSNCTELKESAIKISCKMKNESFTITL